MASRRRMVLTGATWGAGALPPLPPPIGPSPRSMLSQSREELEACEAQARTALQTEETDCLDTFLRHDAERQASHLPSSTCPTPDPPVHPPTHMYTYSVGDDEEGTTQCPKLPHTTREAKLPPPRAPTAPVLQPNSRSITLTPCPMPGAGPHRRVCPRDAGD